MFAGKLKHNFTGKRKSKWNNTPTVRDGIRFDSKREADYYDQLKLEQTANEVLFFLMQVPIRLPDGEKLRIDFQVFYADGSVRFIDVKGKPTRDWLTKKAWAENIYPIEIETV